MEQYVKSSFETENGYKRMTDEKKIAIKEEIDLITEYIAILDESGFYRTS